MGAEDYIQDNVTECILMTTADKKYSADTQFNKLTELVRPSTAFQLKSIYYCRNTLFGTALPMKTQPVPFIIYLEQK
jgi:hypothetical protein